VTGIDAAFEALFALQETNVRRLGPVELLMITENTDKVEFDTLIFGREWNREAPGARERCRIVD
jgi:hypothetical protein